VGGVERPPKKMGKKGKKSGKQPGDGGKKQGPGKARRRERAAVVRDLEARIGALLETLNAEL